MATVPQDATHDVQLSFEQLNDEIRRLRVSLRESHAQATRANPDLVTQAQLRRALEKPKFLDFQEVFRAAGPAHAIGYVPSDGRWMSGAHPEGHERVLREDAVWGMPQVQGPYAIQADDPHDKHTLNGSLHIAGALASSKLMTGAADIFGPVLVHGEIVMSGLGLPSGSCYGNNLTWSQASAVQNTWYPISDSGISDGTDGLTGVAHDGNGELTVTYGGRYLLSYGVSVDNQAGLAIELTPRIDDSEIGDARIGVDPAGPAQHALSSTAVIHLDPGGAVDMSVRTTTIGSPTIGVEFYSLSLVHIGGEI